MAAATGDCNAPPAPKADWRGCNNLSSTHPDLTGAIGLSEAICSAETVWPNGTNDRNTCPSSWPPT